MFTWRYRCDGADAGPATSPKWHCPIHEEPLDIAGPNSVDLIDLSAVGIRRYLPLLPVDSERFSSLGGGMTPILRGTLAGMPVTFKLDSLLPTGSFKDRGAAVAVAHLASCGVTKIVVDSSGNAAASMAAFAAANRIECAVYAPSSASPAKLVQARAYGATVFAVEGSREAVAAEAQCASSEDASSFYASHNWSPVFAEGVKTWAIEVWEQLGAKSPDTVFVPTGGGSALVGAHRGFSATGTLPRIIAAQPAACAPLVAAIETGAQRIEPAVPNDTLAEGARIGNPPRGKLLLEAVRSSSGSAVAVSEQGLVEALRALWSQGIYAEPTAALGAAAFITMARNGQVDGSQTNVILITGAGLKATDTIRDILNEQ